MTALAVLAVVIVATLAAGTVLRVRSGTLRTVGARTQGGVDPDLGALGVGGGTPVLLHFSAPWCGPCSAVRRVIAQVLRDDPSLAHDIELDLDENASRAKKLGVLSLPTTIVFDAQGRERFRASGVPSASDLRAALGAL